MKMKYIASLTILSICVGTVCVGALFLTKFVMISSQADEMPPNEEVTGPAETWFGPLQNEPMVHPARLDSATYVYGEPDDFQEGLQGFGTMHKVGVNRNLLESHPNLEGDLRIIGADNEARQNYVLNEGIEVTSNNFWNVLVGDLLNVAGKQRYVVVAVVGNDPGPVPASRFETGCITTLFELWEKRAGQPPLLLRRSVEWIPEESELP